MNKVDNPKPIQIRNVVIGVLIIIAVLILILQGLKLKMRHDGFEGALMEPNNNVVPPYIDNY